MCCLSSCWATSFATPSIRDCAEEAVVTLSVGTSGKGDVEVLDTQGLWQPVDGLLLEVDQLQVEFRTRDGVAKAINGASFELHEGETLAILGESGSGKSVTAQAIMGILDSPPGFITNGEVRYCGQDILKLSEDVRRRIRGPEISMVFQDALSSLNPVFPVGWQIAEMFRMHRGMNKSDAQAEAIRLMQRVQIPGAAQRVKAYPHQFSGGMRQRIMIAMAIALDPAVLIADEPTTALDVTVQAQIMQLLKDLQQERKMGLILITHDLGVVADVADRIAVMYAGRIMEQADAFELYAQPAHPYTKGLLDSIPRLDQKGETLSAIGGLPPNLMHIPPGCPFNPRCHYAQDICRVDPPPPLREVVRQRLAACHFSELLLAHSPELEVTQTTEEVEAHLERELLYPTTDAGLDHDEDIERGVEPR
jgi:oligopeptide transport system ATP-binding protein